MTYRIAWANHRLHLDQRTHIVGILNVTPDSFSDGGRYFERNKAVEHGLHMARQGADIIDVGGESTRPYSKPLSAAEETDRVIPVIASLVRELAIPISIDTYKAEVAVEALRAGASIINDISALGFDPMMASVAAQSQVPVILMHMKGSPQNMQENPTYQNVVSEIIDYLKQAIARAERAGIREDVIIVDPGIGFGKTFNHNLQIIKNLSALGVLNKPVLLGPSNKAFIGHILNRNASERDTGSMAAVAAGVMNGAHLVRVHNVEQAVETVKVIDAVQRSNL